MKVIVIGPRGKNGETDPHRSLPVVRRYGTGGCNSTKGRDYIGKDLSTVAMTGFRTRSSCNR